MDSLANEMCMDEEEKEIFTAEKEVLSPLDNLLELQDISGFWIECDEFYKVALSKEKMSALVIEQLKSLSEEVIKKVLATLITVKLLNTKFIVHK